MKKSLYAIYTAALLLVSSGCKKDFLEELPNEQLSPEQITEAAEKDPSLLNGSINGLYATMYNMGTGGSGADDPNHDDFGQKGYDIYADLLSSDMVLGGVNYGWFEAVARYQATTNYTYIEAYQPWRYYYRIILGANTVIDALGGTDVEPTDQTRKHIMGQAKTMRGYAYFYLAQFYSSGYGTGNEKILPIYTKTGTPNMPLSTSAEVYNLIINDLTQAIDYLADFNRSSKDKVNQHVAKGLLAYALAARGTTADLQRVITLTDELIAGPYRLATADEVVARLDPATGTLLNPAAGFNNVASPNWIWGVDLTLANELDLVSWWGQVDLFTYSYAWAGDPKVIDEGLYSAIKPEDVRKAQFDPEYDLMPVNKFFDPNREEGGQRNVVTDYVYMRIEEMYLLNAEAKAKLDQDGPARERLKELLVKRMADVSYVDALSGQALDNEIYLQTRIELWGEGKSYLALKRNKATATRGQNHIFDAGESFSYNSDEMTFPIPQAEILNNPVINQ